MPVVTRSPPGTTTAAGATAAIVVVLVAVVPRIVKLMVAVPAVVLEKLAL